MSFRSKLLSTTVLAVAGSLWVSPAALAIPATPCDTVAGATTTITCSSDHVVQIDTAGDPTLVTLNPDATVTWNGGTVISLEGDADLVQKADSVVSGSSSRYAVELLGGNNSATLNDGASIVLTNANSFGSNSTAVRIAGETGSNDLTLNGGSTINVYGGSANKYGNRTITGVSAYGEDFTVTLNGGSSINVVGTGTNKYNTYVGASLDSFSDSKTDRPSITLNGASTINVSNSKYNSNSTRLYGIRAQSIDSDKYAPDVVLNGGSSVTLNAENHAGYAHGIYSEGLNANVTLSGGSVVRINGYSGTNGGKYVGIYVGEQGQSKDLAGTVTLNGGSSVALNIGGAASKRLNGIVSYGRSGDAATNVVLNDSSIDIALNGGSNNNVKGVYVYGSESTVSLNGTSAINVTSFGSSNNTARGIHQYSGYQSAIEMNGSSEINIDVTAGNSFGIQFSGSESTVTLNGTSSINVAYSKYSRAATGIRTSGINNIVTLNGDSEIRVGEDVIYATGIYANGAGSQVVLNGNASIEVGGYYTTEYATGIYARSGNVSVTLNDNASVRVNSYASSHGDAAGVVLGGGSGSSLTLNGNSSISATGYGRPDGVLLTNSGGASVTLNGTSSIYAYGDGIFVDEDSDYASINIGAGAEVYGRNGIRVDGYFSDINIAGTVYGWNNSIDLSGGHNNTLTLNSARMFGNMRAGDTDTLILMGAGVLSDEISGFGLVTVNATGIWNLDEDSEIAVGTIEINSGKLAANGYLVADDINVNSGGTLGGSGDIIANVNVLAGGTLSPGNSPGTLNVVGNVGFASGSIFDVEIEATAADLLNVTGNVNIDPGAIINATFGAGADGFVGDIVTSTGVVTGVFTPGSGTSVDYSDPTKLSLTAASPSSINGSIGAGSAATFGFLDTVLGQAEKSRGVNKNLWASVVSTRSDRSASANSRGFSQKGNGGAFGGNLMQTGGFTLGLAGGYTDTSANTTNGGSRSTIDGYNAALYTSYEMGNTYFTAAVTGAYQDMDITRQVFSSGTLIAANGNTNAWLGGVGFGIGHAIPLNGGFTLTPKASLGWQHQTRKGYTETGGGAGGFSVGDVSSDTIRGLVGAELGLKIQDPNAKWSVRPSIRAGLAQEWREGDTSASGTFNATGGGFTAALDTRDQTYLALGAGVDVTVGGGVTAFASYDGGFGGDAEKSGGIRVGARFAW
tara:strand:+ start:1925 stop:5506 length:3582 start_codon:yes stop_codon:yes gene_type:complete